MNVTSPTNDAIIRAAIRKRLAHRAADDSDTLLVEELPVGRGDARLDMAIINGRIEGIEIKSSVDTLNRLSRQIKVYGEGVDRMSLFVATNHLKEALTHVPRWWAVYEVIRGRRGGLSILREQPGCSNPECTLEGRLRLLERDELLGLLARNGYDRGLRSATWAVLAKQAIERLSPDQIVDGTRLQLKIRILIHAQIFKTAFGKSALGMRVCPSRFAMMADEEAPAWSGAD